MRPTVEPFKRKWADSPIEIVTVDEMLHHMTLTRTEANHLKALTMRRWYRWAMDRSKAAP